VFTGAGACDIDPLTGILGTTCSTEAFHYRKNNLGVDLGYRLNPQNKISGGWDYLDATRERIDFEESKDHKVYVEWKNSSFDLLSARIKYQRLQRRSDFGFSGVNPAANANNFFNYYVKRFDLVDSDQNLVKLVLDSSPAPFLDLGAELIYKDNRYKNVALGRNDDKREELYLTASYGDPKSFRVSAFFDYEETHYDSTHQQGNPTTAPACGAPCSTSATRFVWTGKVKDKNYLVGVGADWPFREWLKFKGSLTWQETDGTASFVVGNNIAPVYNIPAYDSFRKKALNLSAIYTIDKNFEATLGYAWENYQYDDASMNGYVYTLGGNYLTGAYAYPQYSANIAYLNLKYKF
jgi:hypothetical protein